MDNLQNKQRENKHSAAPPERYLVKHDIAQSILLG